MYEIQVEPSVEVVQKSSRQARMDVGGTIYILESRPLERATDRCRYEYRVWLDGVVIKTRSQGSVADFFGNVSLEDDV